MDQRLGRSDEKEGDGPEEVLQGAEGGTLDTVERRHEVEVEGQLTCCEELFWKVTLLRCILLLKLVFV